MYAEKKGKHFVHRKLWEMHLKLHFFDPTNEAFLAAPETDTRAALCVCVRERECVCVCVCEGRAVLSVCRPEFVKINTQLDPSEERRSPKP